MTVHPGAACDLSPFNPAEDDAVKIDGGKWVPCCICREIYGRIRLTVRFCASCRRAFCDGEHGRFAQGQRAFCVRCYSGGTTTELSN